VSPIYLDGMQNSTRRKRPQGPARRQGRRNMTARGDNQMISHPPQIPSYGITRDVRIRFAQNAAGATNITFQNLLDAIAVCTSTTTAADLFEAVRVNSVELWAIAALGTPATVILSFDGTTAGSQGDQKTHTDTSMGIEPAHVKASPDRLTQAGQFQSTSTAVAFILTCPAGTVIDVSMSYRQPVLGEVNATQNPVVGGVSGLIFYRGLDGKTTALTNIPVVGASSVL
jgi:hypothetical protein